MTVTGYANLGRTVAEMITDLETHLGTSRRSQLNKVNGAVGSGDTTVTFEHTSGPLRPQTYVEIDDEVMFVWSVAGQVATVERGQRGSTAAAHADNSLIRIQPRFTRVDMLKALRQDITAWPTSVFAVMRGTFTVGAHDRSIDLDGVDVTEGLRLLRFEREVSDGTGNPTRWSTIPGAHLVASSNATDYPSGWSVSWPQEYCTAGEYQLTIGGPFKTTPFTSATDVGAIGLTASMLDIAPFGAAVRLLFPREIERTNDAALGRSRLAEEVPPGHASRTAQELLGLRDRRLAEEAKRLMNDYGWKER